MPVSIYEYLNIRRPRTQYPGFKAPPIQGGPLEALPAPDLPGLVVPGEAPRGAPVDIYAADWFALWRRGMNTGAFNFVGWMYVPAAVAKTVQWDLNGGAIGPMGGPASEPATDDWVAVHAGTGALAHDIAATWPTYPW